MQITKSNKTRININPRSHHEIRHAYNHHSFILLMSACVSSSKFEAALAEKEAMSQSLESAQNEISRNKEQLKKAEQELAAARAKVTATQDELAELEAKKQALQKELSDSQEKMATLSNIEAETKRRNEIYAQFVNRLKTMIDGGQLTVSIEQGRIVINLPNNVLFKSGSAHLNPDGKEALTQIAAVLSQFSDRRFQIEGHTDNMPIKSARFPSNWELSTSRALTVIHLLTDMGVSPEIFLPPGLVNFTQEQTMKQKKVGNSTVV